MLSRDETEALAAAFAALPAGDRRLTADLAARIADRTGLPLRKVEYFALTRSILPQRYERNTPALSPADQARLLAASAVIVGLGGLGGHVVECLARLGVGRIAGVDPDVFAESNLNRQVLATPRDLGSPKAEQARLRVAAINPAVEFAAHAADVRSLGREVFDGCGVVLDCLDSFPARRALAGLCRSAGVVLVHGAIAGWGAQVAVVPPGSDVMDRLCGREQRGVEQRLGCLPFTAGAAAHLMAAEACKVLLGRSPPGGPRVQYLDLLEGDFEQVDL